MQDWFLDAKFGIFIHWGIYSEGDWSESWPIFHQEVPYDVYMRQAERFTACAYDPDAWAALFARSGAKYAVLTAKHHDGFALWPTSFSSLNAVEGAPAGRDLIGPYCDALRRHGLKVGLYFSHLDWSHPDYASVLPKRTQPHTHGEMHANPFAYPQKGEDPAAWLRFLEFLRGQLKELCDLYQPDLLWFDGDWERDPEQWGFEQLRKDLREWAPQAIVNSRMGGYGAYGTPEQAIPIQPPKGPWEFCVTLNDHWGFFKGDDNHKTPRMCARMLAECAGMGGNLLLDVGPRSDGSIPPEQVGVLESLGAWTSRVGEALYETVAGLPHGHFYGASTLAKDLRSLYLFAFDRPVEGLAVKGIRNEVLDAEVLGFGPVGTRKIGGAPWAGLPGVLWVDIPEAAIDPLVTVVKLRFASELDLYAGAGDPVTLNV